MAITTFWDRCRQVGRAGDRYLWECPKDTDTSEIDCLFEGLEAIEAPHTIWILTETPLPRFSEALHTMGATIDRIADTFIDEGMDTPVAKKGKSQ